ncbi:MAG: glutamate-5-semialdehyde dehydrogenase [Holdemanella sp.]|nr:glutamate-5-semialdehyde dehydrogenase [Holdemanella sp.]
MTTLEIMQKAKSLKKEMATINKEDKNRILISMANALIENSSSIMEANEIDMEAMRGIFNESKLDRLYLDEKRIQAMANGILDVVKLEDPCHKVLREVSRPNGLKIQRVSVPMGVIAIIYESRPNVTSDAAALAIKSGNVCILRTGKEAWNSANAIVKAMQKGIESCGYTKDMVQLIEDISRNSANELMTGVGYIDLLIPRGGKGLIQACVQNAKVPCIETGTGICTVFVDESANLENALNIIENAKTSRPSVCNAAECLLVHEKVADVFLPMVKERLSQVELRLDEKASAIIEGTKATEEDFDTEFLDYILAVKVVSSLEEAIDHIAKHSTGHSESIITENMENADIFTSVVDSAAVYVNASTRFTDGGEFGLGCEMGISTQKLHARGPMGLEELTTYKYVITGNGQIR